MKLASMTDTRPLESEGGIVSAEYGIAKGRTSHIMWIMRTATILLKSRLR